MMRLSTKTRHRRTLVLLRLIQVIALILWMKMTVHDCLHELTINNFFPKFHSRATMVDMMNFIRNHRLADRHAGFSTGIERGKMVVKWNGVTVPDRPIPADVRQDFINRQLHLGRLEARVGMIARYEAEHNTQMRDQRVDGKQLFFAAMEQVGAPRSSGLFASQTDKCQDEYNDKFQQEIDHMHDLELKYGATNVHAAEMESQTLANKYNQMLVNLPNIPEAGLAQRDFIFSSDPWTKVQEIVNRFAGRREAERKAVPRSPWNDRAFLSDSPVVRELASRTTSLSRVVPAGGPTTISVRVTLTSSRRLTQHIHVPATPQTTLADIKRAVVAQMAVPAGLTGHFTHNVYVLSNEAQTLESLGIALGEMIDLGFWNINDSTYKLTMARFEKMGRIHRTGQVPSIRDQCKRQKRKRTSD